MARADYRKTMGGRPPPPNGISRVRKKGNGITGVEVGRPRYAAGDDIGGRFDIEVENPRQHGVPMERFESGPEYAVGQIEQPAPDRRQEFAAMLGQGGQGKQRAMDRLSGKTAQRQAQRKAKAARRPWIEDEKQVQKTFAGIMSKATYGAGGPTEDLVPYGQAFPEAMRKQIPLDEPIAGFNVSKFNKREKELFNRLVMATKAEEQQRRQQEAKAAAAAAAAQQQGQTQVAQ